MKIFKNGTQRTRSLESATRHYPTGREATVNGDVVTICDREYKISRYCVGDTYLSVQSGWSIKPLFNKKIEYKNLSGHDVSAWTGCLHAETTDRIPANTTSTRDYRTDDQVKIDLAITFDRLLFV